MFLMGLVPGDTTFHVTFKKNDSPPDILISYPLLKLINEKGHVPCSDICNVFNGLSSG